MVKRIVVDEVTRITYEEEVVYAYSIKHELVLTEMQPDVNGNMLPIHSSQLSQFYGERKHFFIIGALENGLILKLMLRTLL